MSDKICQIDGCKRKIAVVKHGLCKAHVNRFYSRGYVGEAKILPRKKHEPFKSDKVNV